MSLFSVIEVDLVALFKVDKDVIIMMNLCGSMKIHIQLPTTIRVNKSERYLGRKMSSWLTTRNISILDLNMSVRTIQTELSGLFLLS